MDRGSDDITKLVRNHNIVDDTTREGPYSQGSTYNDKTSLRDALHALIRSTTNTTSFVQSGRFLTTDTGLFRDQSVTKLSSLREGIEKLTDVASNLQDTVGVLNEAVGRSIIIHLTSYESRSTSTW